MYFVAVHIHYMHHNIFADVLYIFCLYSIYTTNYIYYIVDIPYSELFLRIQCLDCKVSEDARFSTEILHTKYCRYSVNLLLCVFTH